MLEITIENLKETLKDFEKFNRELNRPNLAQIAFDQIARIKERTLRGFDYKGDTFKYYSESRRKKRVKKGVQTSHVDLFDSGKMFGAMSQRAYGKDSVILYFAGLQQAAKAHGLHYGYEPHKLPARPFFAFSEQDEKDVKEDYEVVVDKLILEYFG